MPWQLLSSSCCTASGAQFDCDTGMVRMSESFAPGRLQSEPSGLGPIAPSTIYGYGEVRDFLLEPYRAGSYDWVITNPPFRLAQEFVIKGLEVARIGVAIVARTTFLESVGRYEAIFREKPLAIFAQFTERVPMLKGRFRC